MRRLRADRLLVDRGLVDSLARAQAVIMAGQAYLDTRRIDKAGDLIPENGAISLKGQDHPWVSRGGLKLAHGLAHFGFSAEGRTAIDVGASTGGFTDVLLTKGATQVYAVDVGHGQLAWKLRSDSRVVVLEKTNARLITAAQVPGPIEALVCDASFIGLRSVLPAPLALCVPGAWAIALIKPQFEATRAEIGPRGVITDPAIRAHYCAEIETWWRALPGWTVMGIVESPITGPEGNHEYLIGACFQPEG
ncbi:TlyA family RNA methyltransferase [Acidisoma cellulosilytica]|uniref:TlyA family RNA methyltransferase n=1 Tax=Acidisoma cellulosilyticum TaxID=2802395 RepID=A0A963Z143_9PROT|nr:TlyA family RNA methyltransferase [Acidisoma cellulosilyticum]MCB8880780.1 TlyA family RNA methyltransferase [Acidisoma cellulosilyticum]